jgi:hypothetical protein
VPPTLPEKDEAPLENLDRQSPTSAQPDGRHLKSAAACYIGSFALIILPTIIAGTMMISGMTARLASGIKIPAPGNINVTLNRLDIYVIWSEPLMTGKVRLRPEDDFNITVYDRDSEQQIKILPVVMESTSTTNGVERKSLAKIVIDRPGGYRLNVKGDFPPTTFLLRRSFLSGWQTF